MSDNNYYYLPAGTILLATANDAQGKEEAVKYAHDNQFQKGDVKIIPIDKQIIIKALKPVQMQIIKLRT
jgi:hypothetical protein